MREKKGKCTKNDMWFSFTITLFILLVNIALLIAKNKGYYICDKLLILQRSYIWAKLKSIQRSKKNGHYVLRYSHQTQVIFIKINTLWNVGKIGYVTATKISLIKSDPINFLVSYKTVFELNYWECFKYNHHCSIYYLLYHFFQCKN